MNGEKNTTKLLGRDSLGHPLGGGALLPRPKPTTFLKPTTHCPPLGQPTHRVNLIYVPGGTQFSHATAMKSHQKRTTGFNQKKAGRGIDMVGLGRQALLHVARQDNELPPEALPPPHRCVEEQILANADLAGSGGKVVQTQGTLRSSVVLNDMPISSRRLPHPTQFDLLECRAL